MTRDAIKLTEPDPTREAPPTVAAPRSKNATVFAFKRRGTQQVEEAMEAAVEAAPVVVVTAPATPERLTLKCPECGTVIMAEGVRPIPVTCPSCGFSDTL